jgi:hypothetical protein
MGIKSNYRITHSFDQILRFRDGHIRIDRKVGLSFASDKRDFGEITQK